MANSPIRNVLIALASVVLGAASAVASPFGINAHVPTDAVLDEIAAAGIEWVRIDFVWHEVETAKDHYDWKIYDRLFERLEERSLRVLANAGGTPAWATSGPEYAGVPDDPGQWQEFIYLAASRYRDRIDAWGLWNEPNLDHFWDGTRTEYIEKILIPGAIAVRAADPRALVCGPDLAHLSSADWDGWLRDVILRAGDSLDVVTHHYYPSNGKAFEAVYDLDQKLNLPWGSPSVRQVLEDSGWWGRPFWLTETGVQSDDHGPGDQADYFTELLRDCFGPEPEARWVERIFFYQMNDGRDPPPTTFGILQGKPGLVRKPAFSAYQHFISAAIVDDGRIVAVNAPLFVAPLATVTLDLTLQNNGDSTWTGSSGFQFEISVDSVRWTVDTSRIPVDFELRPGATARLKIPLVAPPDSGGAGADVVTVDARMVAGDGRRFGDPLRLEIAASSIAPPLIRLQPTTAVVMRGQRAVLSVDAESTTALHYRWRRNSVELEDGAQIMGSHSSRLKIRNMGTQFGGDYDCVVGNAAGEVVTAVARLSVAANHPRSPGRRVTP